MLRYRRLQEGFSYDETDVVTCDTVSNLADGVESGISVNTTYTNSVMGEGSCSGTATFTRQ